MGCFLLFYLSVNFDLVLRLINEYKIVLRYDWR